MEPQTALALPDEDNCVKVFSSSQAPEYVHSVIATCLGIPEHNVRVITRRVGGGFGGKAIKSMPVSFFFFLIPIGSELKACKPSCSGFRHGDYAHSVFGSGFWF